MVSTYTVQFDLYSDKTRGSIVILSSLDFRCGSTGEIMGMDLKNSVIHILTLSRFKGISTMLKQRDFVKAILPLVLITKRTP